MITRLLNCWMLILLLAVGFNSRAQYHPPLYCLAVKQQFSSWGECGDNPYFRSASITLYDYGQPFTLTKDVTIPIPRDYINTGSKSNIVLQEQANSSNKISKLKLYTLAGGILNDNNLSYEMELNNVGANIYSAEASDPCSNNFNWGGKREGYVMTTTVYVDDPVDLSCPDSNRSYSAEEGKLLLITDDFFMNWANEKPELEVALENTEDWVKVSAKQIIAPKKSYVLTYEDIVGKKIDPSSKFFEWMGKGLQFRVVKTLLNGSKSVGLKVGGVRFYPRGLQFSIKQVERSYCNPNLKVKVQLENEFDKGYVSLDSFYWSARRADGTYYMKGQEQILGQEDPKSLIYEVALWDEQFGDVFNHPDIGPGEWELQLQERKNTNNYACVKSFIIPPKPNALEVSQLRNVKFAINGQEYDVPDYNHPFAMLSIKDDFFYLRKPYIIVDSIQYSQNPSNPNILATINELPSLNLTEQQLTEFRDDSIKMRSWTSAYKTFFQNKYRQWINNQTKAKVLNPNGDGWFYSYSYHSHSHTHTCQHSHSHEHKCRVAYLPTETEEGKYYCESEHVVATDPHNLCDNNHTHSEVYVEEIPDSTYVYQTHSDSHQHSATHDHEHTHDDGIHNYHLSIPDYNKPEYNHTVIKKHPNVGSVVNFSDIYDGNAEVSLQVNGYSAKYIVKISNINNEVPLWDEGYIQNSVYPDKGVAKEWFDEYMQLYKDLWVSQKVGVKVSNGILVNQPSSQTLQLIDEDGCPYSFDVSVTAPPIAYFSTSVIKVPTSLCANNGEVRVTFNGGGSTPYVHSTAGSLNVIGNSIIVGGMKFGDNSIHLSDGEGKPSITLTVNIPSPCTASASPQTCSTPNGKVVVNVHGMTGNKTYKLTSCTLSSKIITHTTTANTFTFDSLDADTYDVLVENGSCSFPKGGIVVESKVFGVNVSSPDVLKLGDLGEVTVEFVNRQSDVIWDKPTAPQVFRSTETVNTVEYTGVAIGEYKTTASHTVNGQTCSIPVEFSVNAPQFNANVFLKMEDRVGYLEAWLNNSNSLMHPYYLELIKNEGGVEIPVPGALGSSIIRNNLADGFYTVQLTYGANAYKQNLYSFEFPLDTIKNLYQVTTPINCHGGVGGVKLTPEGGVADGVFDASTTSTSENAFSSTMDYVVGNSFSYFLRSRKNSTIPIGNSSITVSESVIEGYTIAIPQPDIVEVDVSSIDVTCYGNANGSISISNPRGGNGGYAYMINNNGVWKGADVVTPNLIPGKYSVRVKDESGCYSASPIEVTITQPAPLELERQVVVQPTCGFSNGSILTEIKGGNGLYRYEWLRNNQPFFQDPIFSDPESLVTDTIYSLGDTLRSGSYNLCAIDNMGCTLSVPIELDVYHNPRVELTPVDVRCFGESNGEVKLSSYLGSGAFDHCTISPSTATTPSTIADPNGLFQNLTSGVYTVSVFDDKGCSTEFSTTVRQPSALLTAEASVLQPVLTMGTATGIIRSTISGGNNGLKAVTLKNSLEELVVSSQQPGSFPFNMNSLYAGDYKLTVVDRKGCEYISDPIQVLEPASLLGFTVVDKKDALCKSQTGSFTVQATGGWGDYKYKRSTQNSFYNSGKFENLYAGSYVVTVKDGYGATYSDTVVIHEPKDSLRAWVAELNNPTCEGNGSVVLGLNGGTAAYKIYNLASNDSLLVPGVQPVSITGLSAGDNQFRVVDGNGCRFNLETNLNNSRLLHVAFDTPTYPSTSSSSDGALSAVVTGGKSPYSYLWRSLFGTPVTGMAATLNNIPSGHYEVSVTEANGCNVTKDLYLPNISDLPLEICYKRDESSYRAGDGYCTLTAAEKNWSSFYIITPSKQKLTFNTTDSTSMFDFRADSVFLRNLEGGDYFIAGISTTNVKFYAEFTIKPYELFGFGKVDVLNASTIGASNGKITLDVIGGGGGNQFRWEKIVGTGAEPQVSQDNEASSILSSIPAGNYKVTVTDCFGNTITEDVKVDEPSSALMISVAESTNESCKDYTDAYVRLTAVGGWDDYQFRSQKSEYFGNSPLFSDLEVGTHRFYIIDKMGAVDSVEVNITEPNYLTSRIVSIDSVSCNGLADGRVEFAVNGGTAPYRFADINLSNLWIDDSVKGQLPAGKYRYIFTDNNNCIGQDTVEVVIPQPDSLLFNNIAVVHTTCEQDNGSIKVKLQGGTVPYRYEWFDSNGNPIGGQDSVGQLVQNGYYTLNVRDKNGCPQKLQQLINPSTNPKVTRVGTTDVVCYGESNGTATIQDYQHGSPSAPLTFTWSNGNTGLSASGYPSGIHHVTVTDTNSCSTVKYFDVVQPDLLRIAIVNSKMPKCFGYSDAFIEALGVGGVGGYSYLWSTGDSLSLLGNIGKGEYGLLLTDANGCEVYGVYPVGEPEELEVDLGDDILMCPGNTRVLDGQEFATHKWSTSQGEVSKERYFTVSKPDSYFLEVTDSIGCLAHDTVAVAIGNSALVADFLVSSGVVLGDTLILYELSNMPLDSMSWDYNNSAFLELDSEMALDYILYLKTLSKGLYNIDLYAYSGGCVSVATKQVEIVEDLGENPDDDGLGNDPLIREFTVNPNPNSGDFTATVKLREVADINLVLFSVASGLKVNEQFEYQLQDYLVDYNLVNLNSGVYLLIAKAGNERRQVKIVIQ